MVIVTTVGECDLALKIFPRLALPGLDSEPYRAQDLMSVPCERCKVILFPFSLLEGYLACPGCLT